MFGRFCANYVTLSSVTWLTILLRLIGPKKLSRILHSDVVVIKRRCKRCKKVKAISSFSHDASRPDELFPWCKTCQSEHDLEHKFQNPEDELNGYICPLCDTAIRGHANRRFCSNTCKERTRSLRENFGLTPGQYRKLIPSDGRCPICRNRVTQWHVEHNHKTGEVTGVTCSRCNVGALATTYHDIEFVRRLLAYLENPPAAHVLGERVFVPPDMKSAKSNVHKIWQYRAKLK